MTHLTKIQLVLLSLVMMTLPASAGKNNRAMDADYAVVRPVDQSPKTGFAFASNKAGYLHAMNFVKSAQLHKGLSLMLLSDIKQDDVVLAAIDKHGFEAVKTMVVTEIKRVVADYRNDWDDKLAGLYSQHLSTASLASIASEQLQSKYFGELIALQSTPTVKTSLTTSATFRAARSDLMAKLTAHF